MIKKLLCFICMFCLLLNIGGCASGAEKYQAEFIGLFDTFTIIIGYAESESEFDRYAQIIYDRMKTLHQLYDIYEEYEGVNNLYTVNKNAGIAPVKVSRDIVDMLLAAVEGFHLTNGTVNIAMGSVLKLWHDYRIQGIENEGDAQLPPMEMLRQAGILTDINDVVIDEANSTVFLRKPGMSLDVGAVAKGYAVGQAAKAAHDAGAVSMLINSGGNVTSIGKPLDNVRERWGIGIQNPDLDANGTQNILDTIYTNDTTVSCSGDYQRYYVVDGQVYSHIIDAATLMPAKLYKQVAVICEDAGMADILSTALFIMTQEDGAVFADQMGVDALWIFKDGSQTATEGYAKISKNMGNYSAVD